SNRWRETGSWRRGFSALRGAAPPSLVAPANPSSLSSQSTGGGGFSGLMTGTPGRMLLLTKFGDRESGHRTERGTARFLAVAKAADGPLEYFANSSSRGTAPPLERGLPTGNRC